MRLGKTILNRHVLLLMILFISGPLHIFSQDVDGLLNLINEGNLDSAEIVLTDLNYAHPGHPGLRYARALMQTDALVAAGLYKDIVRNHGSSNYVAGSLMRLGEYYFAQGLYVQSRQFFSRLIRFHPEHPGIVNAVNLSLRAGIASRQMDSVYIDLADIVKRYPGKAFDIPEELDLTRIPGQSSRRQEMSESTPAPIRSLGEDVKVSEPKAKGAFVLQAGAFGQYANARRLADQIESIGYTTRIDERVTNNKTLFLIMVGDYETRTAAMSVADMLEAALGVPSFPVANN